MPGNVCLVLHAHLPFVRHPEHASFLEEDWLYEAITAVYLPLLGAFERLIADRVPFRVAMTLSPTLVSMFRDDLLMRRYARRLDDLVELADREVRRTSAGPLGALARFYRERFAQARADFHDRHRGDLVGAFRALRDRGAIEILGCAATHAFLPLLAPTPSAVRGQVAVGADVHRRAFGGDPAGFWLPECGYFPGLDRVLAAEGVRYVILESHALLDADPRPRYGVFAPVLMPSGVAAFGRDPESSRSVWSATDGYPGDPAYRDFYRDIGFELAAEALGPFGDPAGVRRRSGIGYYRVTGSTDAKDRYDRERALAVAERHAEDFWLKRARQCVGLAERMGGRTPVVVAAFDAELFGHWWFEGPEFLERVVRESASAEHAFRLVAPSDHLRAEPALQVAQPSFSSWGDGGYAQVWLDDANAWIWGDLHAAARRLERLANSPGRDPLRRRALAQAAREGLLAQASDWAFMMRAGTTVEYAVRRTRDHLERFRALADGIERGAIDEAALAAAEARENLFPDLDLRHFA